MGKPRLKPKCMTCRRSLEPFPVQWAAGPVCYPCYWGAKLEYEDGITQIDQIPQPLRDMLGDIFVKRGYDWPFDLIEAWKSRQYEKANTELRRWWSPKDDESLDKGPPKP